MNHLVLVGLNHTTAPLAVRERLSFDGRQRVEALSALQQKYPQCEAVLLSTCNRVELYASWQPHAHPMQSELVEFLATLRGFSPEELNPLLYYKTEREVAAHLFTVASSLDSMVVGEAQILGQVREAYEQATQSRSAGPMLHPLFQRALAVGKQVMTETTLGEGRLSVASIAVEYARRIFDTFSDKTILNIGAGKMASLVLANLVSLSPGRLLVCNRDPAKADALAAKFRGQTIPYENLQNELAAADIIVSSTGSQQPILTRAIFETVMRRRRYKPVFLIDIAVPRDAADDVGKLQNVYLYNLDDLQQVAAATRGQRSGAIEAAQKIVADHVRQFVTWHRARQLGPVIDQLYRRSHELAMEELNRTLARLPGISPAEKEHLEDLTRRVVNKLLHDPVQLLRESEGLHGPTTQYMHALEKLFKLDPEEAEDAPDA
jgi:glutamyl-tRNA reductase